MTEQMSGRRRVAVGLAAMAVGAIGLAGAFPSAAGATGGGDLPFEHPCPDEGWYLHWGPQNQDTIPGTHNQDDPAIDEPSSDEEFSVDISNVRTEDERRTFDFSTSVPVRVVLALGYPSNYPNPTTEYYDPAVTEGTISVDDPTYIKHVVFCPGEETPTTTESTTTTTEATTTTTVEETTTTTAPPTSESTSTSVAPTTPSTETPSTAPPSTQPASDEELPRTGNNTMPLVAGAAALLAVGVALVVGRRFLQNRATS